MGYLGVLWVVAGAVVAFWLFMGFRYRNARLDRLPLLEGETLCFDDDQARCAVLGHGRAAKHPSKFTPAVIRLTSRRLIVARPQGRIARLRWAVYHQGSVPEGMGNAWSDGYVSFATSPKQISVQLGAERRVLRISPIDGALTSDVPARLSIESPRLGEYLAVLRHSS